MALAEELMAAAFQEGLKVSIPLPFPRLTYAEAMDRFGCDKPDCRYGMELRNLSAAVGGCGFRMFEEALAQAGEPSFQFPLSAKPLPEAVVS